MSEKTVDEKTFKECCDLMLSGRMHPDVAAYLTGLSRPTFRKRLNQFYDPERYGPLPDNFFDGRKDDIWKENTGWIKESSAIRKYLAKEAEKKEALLQQKRQRRQEKRRDSFIEASKLPRLED